LELQTDRRLKVIKSKLFVVIGSYAMDRQLVAKMRA